MMIMVVMMMSTDLLFFNENGSTLNGNKNALHRFDSDISHNRILSMNREKEREKGEDEDEVEIINIIIIAYINTGIKKRENM